MVCFSLCAAAIWLYKHRNTMGKEGLEDNEGWMGVITIRHFHTEAWTKSIKAEAVVGSRLEEGDLTDRRGEEGREGPQRRSVAVRGRLADGPDEPERSGSENRRRSPTGRGWSLHKGRRVGRGKSSRSSSSSPSYFLLLFHPATPSPTDEAPIEG